MKKVLGLVAIVAVFSTGVSFGLSRWLAMRRPMAVNLHDTAWLISQLHLTDAAVHADSSDF